MNDSTLKILNSLSVLLVEDDEYLSQSLESALIQYCGKVRLFKDGISALNAYENGKFDLVVTDINIPKLNGLQLAKKLHAQNLQLPIIIITAYDSEKNVKEAISLGAFAFLQKPFSLKQFYSSLLMASAKVPKKGELFHLGYGFEYDMRKRELYKNKTLIHLTKTEAAILQILISNAGHVASIQQLEYAIWQDRAATPDTIRTHINNLRSKVYRKLILNVQGYGYRLELPLK
ncbi:response regulator transcription factor [Campylobacter sp. faydin G-140]|uniref:response regulator transcription factor n=1 Tax=Campylobacter anatolicus TaxID=2829105 RepID=UPI001B9D8A1F|nr:response regulator transcription factor [Campylobacter anatolicus]MBR8465283.1 response regulator transcription factor [Campylobacter anatolicus]